MRIIKRQYIFTWIALVAVIFAATVLLLLPSFTSMASALKKLVAFIAWGLVVVPAIFLFLKGSKNTLARIIQMEEDPEPAGASSEKLTPEPGENKALDIKTVAGKITRRTDPAQPPGIWGKQLIDILVTEIEIMSAIFYYRDQEDSFASVATYATPHSKDSFHFKEGEGLNGQVAKNGQVQVLRTIPEQYAKVFSGLGSGSPAYLAIVPIVVGERTIALLEVAGFRWAEDPLEQMFHVMAHHFSEQIAAAKEQNNKGKAGPQK